ncbi:hypothetical protein JCM8547_001048 [Rhodosporidiobolus lusitaniae]
MVALEPQFVVLAASTAVALSSGTNYAFSSWAPQLAANLHLSSTAINVVGAAGNAGVYLSGPLIGLVVDRRGPRIVLLLAAACSGLGYFGLHLLYDSGPDGLYQLVGLPGLSLCQVLTGVGGSAGLAAAVKATSLSFSKAARGTAMALVLSGFGLSAFFYSAVSHANLFSTADPTSGFLLTLTLGCTLSMLFGLIFIRPPSSQPGTPPHHHNSSPSSSRTPYLAVPTGPDDAFPSSSDHDRSASEFSLRSDIESPRRSLESGIPERPASRRRQRSSSPLLVKQREDDHVPHGAGDWDVSGSELVRSGDFQLLFVYLGLMSGVGLLMINNLGTVVVTLAGADANPHAVSKLQSGLVSLLSICNCLGRLAVGFSSDAFLHRVPLKMRFARIWWLVVTAALFVLSQLLASRIDRVEGVLGMTIPVAAAGFAYGFLFGSIPVVVLERFGIMSFSTNWGFMSASPAFSAPATNLLFGAIYDSHVPPSPSSPIEDSLLHARAGGSTPAHLCTLGNECFAQSFHVTTMMSLVAVGIAVVLSLRRSFKPVYHT